MNHPKIGQTCHAARTEQKHEGENALHTMELQDYNHDIDSKQEENTMAVQLINGKPELAIVSPLSAVPSGAPQDLINPKKRLYQIAENIIQSQIPEKRLQFMQNYLKRFTNPPKDLVKYTATLENLVKEKNGDFSNPVTQYGCLIHFRSLSEDEFIEEIKGLKLHFYKDTVLSEEIRREAHRAMMKAVPPELTEEEHRELYATGSSLTPELREFYLNGLEDPADELIFEYCGEVGNYDIWESSDWVAEEALECLSYLKPDLLELILTKLYEAKETIFR